jgi:hypothetical protein
MLYILPLISGWSPDADLPINCFAFSNVSDGLVLLYPKASHEEVKVHPNYINKKELENFTYYVYNIEEKYLDDYRLLLKGKFSKIKESTKTLILSRTRRQEDYDKIDEILYKSSSARKRYERMLEIPDIDNLVDEYESKFGEEEILILGENE